MADRLTPDSGQAVRPARGAVIARPDSGGPVIPALPGA